MATIEVYSTPEEAKRQLERYENDNRNAHDALVSNAGAQFHQLLEKQTYFLVMELGAQEYRGSIDFYFESIAFPFYGITDFCDDIPSLVREIKDAAECQTPKNIEVILYT
ncbi:hypothetical protein HY496_03085, partial [Candidatus Woesearchaeota archaeon]|nr:hypothetical protein [Candidatus Woesearchaeota archaeon]